VSSLLLYDTGCLLAAEKGSQIVWSLHRHALTRGSRPLVPAGVLAQAWRDGARQAQLARLLQGCDVVDLDAATAKRIGTLLGASDTPDVIDAHVAVLAADRAATVITSDVGDIEHLLGHLGHCGGEAVVIGV
jgi:hypothetical protein